MAKILVHTAGCLITLLLILACCSATLDESITRCAESCLKINPYDNVTHPDTVLVKHCAKLTVDGKCECDWEKILTPNGECICRNPRQTVNELNQCVCDPKKCPVPMTSCERIITDKKELLDDCCPQFECDDCPDDSYRSNSTQDDKCICYPCTITNCKDDQSTVIIRKGNQKPGTCCDLYKCEDLTENKPCLVDGKYYSNGESWIRDGCAQYRCDNGIIFNKYLEDCKDKRFCVSNGHVYANQQSWMEDDYCTNCTCDNGVKKCMAHFCKDLPSATIRPTEEDCPLMVGCRKACPFGFKLNKRGCDVCKCRQPDAKTVQDILRSLNCTAESCNILHVLPSNCSGITNASVEQCPKCTDPLSDPQANTVLSLVLLAACIALTIICGVLFWLLCRERRRALCTLHRPHTTTTTTDKYLHIPMFDANLNTQDNKSAMLLSATGKPTDLMEYR